MTGKDRTLEFQKISESFKAQNGSGKALAKPANHSLLAVRALASEISKETAETALKLKELTKRKLNICYFSLTNFLVAKTKSPFGDPTSKIDEYTYTIKQGMLLTCSTIVYCIFMIRYYHVATKNTKIRTYCARRQRSKQTK